MFRISVDTTKLIEFFNRFGLCVEDSGTIKLIVSFADCLKNHSVALFNRKDSGHSIVVGYQLVPKDQMAAECWIRISGQITQKFLVRTSFQQVALTRTL